MTSASSASAAANDTIRIETGRDGRGVVTARPVGSTEPLQSFLTQVGATTPGRWQPIRATDHRVASAATAVRAMHRHQPLAHSRRVHVHVAADSPDNLHAVGAPRQIWTTEHEVGSRLPLRSIAL